MDIQEIRQKTKSSSPFFFSPSTLQFFGQTMDSFEVSLQEDGRHKISAPIIDSDGKNMGDTVRYFNPDNHELELS